MTTQTPLFAIVELFGHARLACTISESSYGDDFIRCDIPETSKQPAFTRIIAKKAVYAINPVSEEVMKLKAESLHEKPIEAWDIRKMHEKLLLNMPVASTHINTEFYDNPPCDDDDE
jgi:hypothetical protein